MIDRGFLFCFQLFLLPTTTTTTKASARPANQLLRYERREEDYRQYGGHDVIHHDLEPVQLIGGWRDVLGAMFDHV